MSLTSTERLDWLRLIRSERVGPVTFHRLVDRFGSAAAALDALPGLAKRGGGKTPKVASTDEAEDEMAAVEKIGATLLALPDEAYPPLLRHIEDAPPLITVKGEAAFLKDPTIGVVGTRNASINGIRMAQKLAADLGAAGHVIASGMARGIDGAAHEAALATGTVAVLAGGVDVIYPKEHTELYERIAGAGALISEMAPGIEPQARHFPRRNRIISGLALGVVVIEAARRSGSLITARMALEQGREVFAVPGSPLDPRAQGTNDLIRQGAQLVADAADVLEGLPGSLARLNEGGEDYAGPRGTAPEPGESELETARRAILELLGPSPVTVDEIIRQCQMSPAAVSTVLLELELAGKLERHPGNQVSLIAEF